MKLKINRSCAETQRLFPRPATQEQGDDRREEYLGFVLLKLILPISPGAKAVLKPPQSTRWRDCQEAPDFAKRLDCGAFTAALGPKTMSGRVSAPLRLCVKK
jgi:hypothetical protein